MTGSDTFDVVIIGSGLGGLTAAALLAQAGKSVCVIERNKSFGGAASCYRIGDLTIEAALHETADPHDPRDPKHGILKRLGIFDDLDWIKLENLHRVAGGPVGDPFTLPHGFDEAAAALAERFPRNSDGTRRFLSRMENIYDGFGNLLLAQQTRSPELIVKATARMMPLIDDWQMTLDAAFARDDIDHEGLKCALAGNLPYYDDDPRTLWWPFFAAAQGAFLGAGGAFVKGGSNRLTAKLARAAKRAGTSFRLGCTATEIETDDFGRPRAVHHVKAGQGESGDTERVEARTVLANCAPAKVATMLADTERSKFEAAFAGMPLSISLFTAHFALTTPAERFGLTAYSTIMLPPWMTGLNDYADAALLLGDKPRDRMPPMTVVNYGAIDDGLGNGDKTLITVAGIDRIENWTRLTREVEHDRRIAWLDAILQRLEDDYPGIAAAVDEKMLVNARSVRDYLAMPDGAVYGFAPTAPTSSIRSGPPRSPRTPIDGLLLASAFAGSGGFSGAMAGGAHAARLAETYLDSQMTQARR